MNSNVLLSERDMQFLLYDVHAVDELTAFDYFSDHDRETFEQFLSACKRFARERMWPSYKQMDKEVPSFGEDARSGQRAICVHPRMGELYSQLANLGVLAASRPYDVGGSQLPITVSTAAMTWLMAGNLSAAGFAFLTTGAAHLVEAFGDTWLRTHFMKPMYAGRFTGTMALTEPHAGSSLADIRTSATHDSGGRYRIRGSKIFISGGANNFSDNIVHLTLARIEDSPAGTRGVSLFAVPKLRPEGDQWVPNDVQASQLIEKIGWKGLPSVVLDYGSEDDCIGWLVGRPNDGLSHMFQMMNEARILVGANAVATASVGYQESLEYAKSRPQGRLIDTEKGSTGPQVPIAQHPDVRRMLLRQKCIVTGGLSLVLETAKYQDIAAHGSSLTVRERAQILADFMTPLAKTFPAEWGYEANTLAVQVHGGYGYSSEYVVEALLRDQKLNSIHEGTTGLQGLDLLGRKILRDRGHGLQLWLETILGDLALAQATESPELKEYAAVLRAFVSQVQVTLRNLSSRTSLSSMLSHSTDMLLALCSFAVGWQWLKIVTQAERAADGGLQGTKCPHIRGLRHCAQYWFATEIPVAVAQLTRVDVADSSFLDCSLDSL